MSDIDGDPFAALAALAEVVDHAGPVIDVGASYGIVTEKLAPFFPQSAFFLFEPIPARRTSLEKKFASNARVQVFGEALSDSNGTATFHTGEFDPASSLFPRNADGKKYFDPRYALDASISVDTLRLDDFCMAHDIERSALLKLDTQGGEHSILKGAAESLSAERFDIIYTEWFAAPHYEAAPLFDAIWSELTAYGYSLYDLFKGPYGTDGQLRYGEAVFISNRFREGCLPDVKPADHAVSRYD